jgi:hypothetical protein
MNICRRSRLRGIGYRHSYCRIGNKVSKLREMLALHLFASRGVGWITMSLIEKRRVGWEGG